METFITTFSFTLGIVAALAALPILFIFFTVGLPNLIIAVITRFASKEWKAKKWNRALELGDAGQIAFLRKWGFDKAV